MGFFTILALIFITLKLTGVIAWSWWLVLLPILPGLFILGLLLAGGTAVGLLSVFSGTKGRGRHGR